MEFNKNSATEGKWCQRGQWMYRQDIPEMNIGDILSYNPDPDGKMLFYATFIGPYENTLFYQEPDLGFKLGKNKIIGIISDIEIYDGKKRTSNSGLHMKGIEIEILDEKSIKVNGITLYLKNLNLADKNRIHGGYIGGFTSTDNTGKIKVNEIEDYIEESINSIPKFSQKN